MGVAVAGGAIAVSGSEERAFHEHDLRAEDVGPSVEETGTRIGTVGQDVRSDIFGDLLAGASPLRDLGFGQMSEFGTESVFVPDDLCAEGGDPVVGGEETEIHVAAELVMVSLRDRDHRDLVWLAALEASGEFQQRPDIAHDGLGNDEGGRRHGVEIPLRRPVSEPSQVVHVAVAENHGPHGWNRAVRPARVETEVKLRQEDDGALTGAGSTNQTQVPP